MLIVKKIDDRIMMIVVGVVVLMMTIVIMVTMTMMVRMTMRGGRLG